MGQDNMTNDIFISYRRNGGFETAHYLYEHLRQDGYRVTFDFATLRSGRFDEALLHRIDECTDFVVVLSKGCFDRTLDPTFPRENDWMRRELGYAIEKKKNVIPVLLPGFEFPEGLPCDIAVVRFMHGPSYSKEYIDAVYGKLKSLLRTSASKTGMEFFETLQSPEYKRFMFSVLKKYYNEIPGCFPNIGGNEFPVFCISGKMDGRAKSVTDLDWLCDVAGSSLKGFDLDAHQGYRKNPWYREYSRLLEGKIHYPNRPGYMLDEVLLDAGGRVEKIRAHVGTYAETVFSSHVLEYEMYQAFLSFREADIENPTIWKQMCAAMPTRKRMHGGVGGTEEKGFPMRMFGSLLQGGGREALLSVLMVVVVKSKRRRCYELKLVERSQAVAVDPGTFQIIPAGGFEILNDSCDNRYSDMELEENFSLGGAVFREYLEELFNVPECAGGGAGSLENRILNDSRIQEIEEMLESGRADFLFLGYVLSLGIMRPELCFALVIHDEAYSGKQFIANEECKKGVIHNIPVAGFESNSEIISRLHDASAGLWHLFRQSPVVRSIVET